MRHYRSLVLVVVMAALCVSAAACGSSSKANTSAATTTEAPTTTAAPATTTTTIDEAAAKTAITAAYVSFLNSADPNYDARVALIQDGTSIKSLFVQLEQQNAKTPSSGKVTNIEFLSSDDCSSNGFNSACAKVTYDIYLASDATKPALAGSTGYAVLDGGTWKVARQTFCALAGLVKVTCPAS